MHWAYVCTLALDCFILLLFYFIKGVLALYHYGCFPFLSTFLYPPSLSQKAKFWLNVAFWKRKIHGIYYTENREEDKQYHKLFFQIQMFDLLTFPNFNFVAIWGKFRFTCATNKSNLIPVHSVHLYEFCAWIQRIAQYLAHGVAFTYMTCFWDLTLLSNFPWLPPHQ